MDEQGKPVPEDAGEFVAQETGGELSNSNDTEETPSQEESVEFQLTPEIEEKIMSKVQDINEPGIGYTMVRIRESEKSSDVMFNILKNGILPSTYLRNDQDVVVSRPETAEDQRKQYAEMARSKSLKWLSRQNVWFNIVGRSSDITEGDDIRKAFYHDQSLAHGYVIIFDPQRFTELEGDIGLGPPMKRLDSNRNSYMSEEALRIMPISPNRDPSKVDSEYGFALNGRIAPRVMEGVVMLKSLPFDSVKKEIDSIAQGKIEGTRILRNEKKWNNRLVKIMSNTERYLPIYDTWGNLRWPKEMSYEEVQQFVVDRDAKKTQSSLEEPQSEPREEPQSESPIQPEELDET